MEPFEKHQADVGELHAASSGLLADASQAGDNVSLTTRAYQPVIENWAGIGSGEAQRAPQPLRAGASNASSALAWAAVVAEFWADQVETFNNEVDRIVDRFQGMGPNYGLTGDPDDDEIAEAREAALSRARNEWWQAYNTHILDGEDQAASMLAQGPTAANLAAAEPWILSGPWKPIGEVGPSTLELLVGVLFGGRGLLYLRQFEYWGGWVDEQLRRHSRTGDRAWLRQAQLSQGEASRALGRYDRFLRLGRTAPYVGSVLTTGVAAADQWYSDEGEGYTNWERAGRAGVTGVTAGVGSLAGAALGTAVVGAGAAAVGTAIGGPKTGAVAGFLGGAIGGFAGGIGGGIAGEEFGRDLNDRGVGGAVGRVGEFVAQESESESIDRRA